MNTSHLLGRFQGDEQVWFGTIKSVGHGANSLSTVDCLFTALVGNITFDHQITLLNAALYQKLYLLMFWKLTGHIHQASKCEDTGHISLKTQLSISSCLYT